MELSLVNYSKKKLSAPTNLIKLETGQSEQWTENVVSGLAYVLDGDTDHQHTTEWKEIKRIEEEEIAGKTERLRTAHSQACAEIKSKIKEGNITLEEAFKDGEYFALQPQHCFCGDYSPTEQAEYYHDHIHSCLGREEKIREFKNKLLEIIKRSVDSFNQRRKEIIEKFAQEVQTKGWNIDLNFWRESLYKYCQNSEQLDNTEQRLNKLIQDFNNIDEEQRKRQEERAQEEDREKQKEAQREKEEQERKEEEKKQKAEQKANERAKKTQKEQEEAETNFQQSFKSSGEFNLGQENEQLNKQMEELQAKLNETKENLTFNNNNPDWQKEKEELEKQLWDLRMNNFTKIPPISSDKTDDGSKKPKNEERDSSLLETGKKSEYNYQAVPFLVIFIIVGGIFLFFIIKKKSKK